MLLKTVFQFCRQITRSKSAGNGPNLQTSRVLFSFLKRKKLLLWNLKWKGKTLIDVKVSSEWKIKVNGALKLFNDLNNFSLP